MRFLGSTAFLILALSLSPGAVTAEGYQGLGAGSVSREVIEQYAPKPFDAELTRRVQMMLDVRSPGMGMPAPDGKRLFFTWSVTGTRQVWRLDGPDRFPVQLTGGEDPTSLADVTPDGKTLVLSRDRKGEENPGLYLQDTGGGPLKPVQHVPGIQTFHQFVSDDGRWLYFKSNDIAPDAYAVYRYDLADGRRELLFAEPGLWNVDDHLPDGRLLLRKKTGSVWAEYFEYDPKTRALKPLFGQGEKTEYTAAYGAKPGELLVLTNKLSDFRRLYRLRDGKYEPVTPELRWDVSGFGIDRPRARVLYTVNEGGYTRMAGLDSRTFNPLGLPKLPEADHVFPGVTTRDGRFTTLGVVTSRSPQASWVYDWRSKALTRWVVPSSPEIDTSRFATASLEEYPARDGTRIPMFVRRPERCDPAPCPVIVQFHGGPEGQAQPGISVHAQLYVDAGFVMVEPNVRGSDGYGKAWLDADNGASRLKVITDIEDCARHIRAHWGKDGKPPRIGVLGGSYGGYAALMGMTMFAGAYDAGVSIVGISNLYTFLKNTAPYRRILRTSEYGDPKADREALLRLSPVTYVDLVKGPLMILQGVSDPRVPAGEALQIRDALAAREVPVELILFGDEGHGAQKRENIVHMIGQPLLFFRKHLQGI